MARPDLAHLNDAPGDWYVDTRCTGTTGGASRTFSRRKLLLVGHSGRHC